MTVSCYYAFLMKLVVSMLISLVPGSNSIWISLVSTMDPHICLIMLHKLQAIKLFLCYVIHKIDIGK